jgi:hypothetical protein
MIWSEIIDRAAATKRSVIVITDDRKEDWWLERSGRTIGPRPEMRKEFSQRVGMDFWMYNVSRFMEEVAKLKKSAVDDKVIAEVEEVQSRPSASTSIKLCALMLMMKLRSELERTGGSPVSLNRVISMSPGIRRHSSDIIEAAVARVLTSKSLGVVEDETGIYITSHIADTSTKDLSSKSASDYDAGSG